MPDDVRQILLQTLEDSLQAQLTAVRRLRKGGPRSTGAPLAAALGTGRSHVSMAYDILQAAGQPLHITEIIAAAQQRFHQKLDRESLVSALTKRLARDERFTRTAPNTFAVRAPAHPHGKEE